MVEPYPQPTKRMSRENVLQTYLSVCLTNASLNFIIIAQKIKSKNVNLV